MLTWETPTPTPPCPTVARRAPLREATLLPVVRSPRGHHHAQRRPLWHAGLILQRLARRGGARPRGLSAHAAERSHSIHAADVWPDRVHPTTAVRGQLRATAVLPRLKRKGRQSRALHRRVGLWIEAEVCEGATDLPTTRPAAGAREGRHHPNCPSAPAGRSSYVTVQPPRRRSTCGVNGSCTSSRPSDTLLRSVRRIGSSTSCPTFTNA